MPLTTIAKQCGPSVAMIEKHYAGMIENWDGKQIPAERQIKAAREGLHQIWRTWSTLNGRQREKMGFGNHAAKHVQ